MVRQSSAQAVWLWLVKHCSAAQLEVQLQLAMSAGGGSVLADMQGVKSRGSRSKKGDRNEQNAPMDRDAAAGAAARIKASYSRTPRTRNSRTGCTVTSPRARWRRRATASPSLILRSAATTTTAWRIRLPQLPTISDLYRNKTNKLLSFYYAHGVPHGPEPGLVVGAACSLWG